MSYVLVNRDGTPIQRNSSSTSWRHEGGGGERFGRGTSRGRGGGGSRGARGSNNKYQRTGPGRFEKPVKDSTPFVPSNVEPQDVIYHMYLPKQLPDNVQSNLVDVEESMLKYSVNALAESITGVELPQLESLKQMFEKWKEIQPKWYSNSDEIHFIDLFKQEIRQMPPKTMLPIYIRKQNCTLLITNLGEDMTQISTFRTMLPSEMIMSTVGSLACEFPETSDIVYNKDLLMSSQFLRHLHDLCVQDVEISLATAKKGEMNFTDYREVPQPFLVADFMIGTLVPAVNSSFELTKIVKKVRDEVNCKASSHAVPFRRSGMWMAIKVALQLKLTQDFGDDDATIPKPIYKLVLLRILTHVCQQYAENCTKVNWDLASQMLAKIGRRVDKIQKLSIASPDEDLRTKIELFKSKCLDYTASVVTQLGQHISSKWKGVASSHPVIKPITRTMQEFQNDLHHTIPWLNTFIEEASSKPKLKQIAQKTEIQNYQKAAAIDKCEDVRRSLKAVRHPTVESILKHKNSFNYNYSSIDEVNERIWMHDTEQYIKQLDDNPKPNILQISELIQAYIKVAVHRCTKNKDPLSASQMILVTLKVIQIVDKIATKKYPILVEYNSGIHPELLDNTLLLLPHQTDVTLLHDIIDYFKIRNEESILPSLIDTNKLSEKSIHARFASENCEMVQTRKRILVDIQHSIEDKNAQVDQVRIDCIALQNECNARGPCNSVNDKQHDNKAGTKAMKAITCRSCLVKRDLKWKRHSVTIYERTLPPHEDLQYAVVFELKIPPEISLLRDLVALLNFEMLGQDIFGGGQNRAADDEKFQIMHWSEYMAKRGKSDDYKSEIGFGVVTLASPRVAASGTCYTKLQNPDILQHSSNDAFIIDNDLDCIIYYEKPMWYPSRKYAEKICSFQLHSTKDFTPYANLQWTLNSTRHTQNQVIASKTKCHKQLSTDEYVALGSLRCGNRTQIRNLFRMIHDRAVALQHEPVLAFVLQTLWQVGPRDDTIWESHWDFTDTQFCLQFLQSLEKLVETVKLNYSEPLILLVAVVITVKILEMNPNCYEKCYSFLCECRQVCETWWDKVEEKISNVTQDNDGSQGNYLKGKLLEATVCSAMSFNVCTEGLAQVIIQTEKDLVHWFHTLSRLYTLSDQEQCHLSRFGQVLLYTAKCIPLKLNLENRFQTQVFNALHTFAGDKWNKVKECDGFVWKVVNDKQQHFLVGEYQEDTETPVKALHTMHFDLIQGTFLVNGFPQSTLPTAILEHPLFRRYFKDTKFRIQRYSTCARTIDKFYGKHYDFEVTITMLQTETGPKPQMGRLVIKEIDENPITGELKILELFESTPFCKFVGNSLSENYTHWIDVKEKKVYFRHVPITSIDYTLPHQYILAKEGNSWKLCDDLLKKHLLSIDSEGFKLITGALARMESREHIYVMMDSQNQVCAKLPRCRLNFNLKEELLHSVEYPGYRVASNQNVGTLIGLQQGLMLELGDNPDAFSKRILLVPHGFLITRQVQHQVTTVEKLREPPIFVYEYDTVLKRLKADKSKAAWLYLAALHAATASSLTDPFTGITGTECAVNILQSGYVWPSEPYDSECVLTLEMIRSFSPRRDYYGHGVGLFSNPKKANEKMEITQWPEVLPPMAAFDGYRLIVDSLLHYSQRQTMFYPEQVKNTCGGRDSEKLQVRAYLRHLQAYNQCAYLSLEYFTASALTHVGQGNLIECTLRSNYVNSEDFYVNELLTTAQTRYVNTFEKVSKNIMRTCLLVTFVSAEDTIVVPPTPTSVMEGYQLKDLLNMNLATYWLYLYNCCVNRTKGKELKHSLTIILSAMAYRGAPLEQVMTLNNIWALAGAGVEFPPFFSNTAVKSKSSQVEDYDYVTPYLSDFNIETIEKILTRHIKFSEVIAKATPKQVEEQQERIKLSQIKGGRDAIIIANQLKGFWPCEEIVGAKHLFGESDIVYETAIEEVNVEIRFWWRNHRFNQFIQQVEDIINKEMQMRKGDIDNSQELYEQVQFAPLLETEMKIELCVDTQKVIQVPNIIQPEVVEEAKKIFKTGKFEIDSNECLANQRDVCRTKISGLMETICKTGENNTHKILSMGGIMPRITPTMLLQYLRLPNFEENSPFTTTVGALAVMWTHLKRLNRCIFLDQKGHIMALELAKELENTGHENWSPAEHPEWLLLELELDIMIRSKQVDVAHQMITMPDGKNGVMQLNMGEGKTAVIVPMLCCTLATSDSLCRVTVLKSIYKTNLSILSFAIGGLINRKVYTFPCKRNLQIELKNAKLFGTILEECLEQRGVILTLPEYRLSFRLLICDKILKGEHDLALKLLEAENWMRYYCRDVLDESDELLNVQYQLVYTTGSEITVDGDSLRWTTCQKILKIVQINAQRFKEKFGSSCVEYNQLNVPHEFPPFRLLSDKCLEEFKTILADELTRDLRLAETRARLVKEFLTQEEISEMNHTLLTALLAEAQDKQNIIWLISGYLRRGVLGLALSKRWRVEYGRDLNGRKRMAVPYRAKDVAAERTDFAHPDLAIVLTHLTYYYEGLSDSQLKEAFEILRHKRDAELIYNDWMSQIPVGKVDAGLLNYKGLNIHDTSQCEALFAELKKHTGVINFWLSYVVFPREATQFPSKLVMNAWDLCHERSRHPVSGFSGTNDSVVLLPLPISQQDLPELLDTNAKLEKLLLQPENCNHQGLPVAVSCKTILEQMMTDGLGVLVDAGALMLECDNEQVAKLALEVNCRVEAVVYFGKDGEILVKCRNEPGQSKKRVKKDVPLELSPYRDRLECCLVYLDDQHTRGTDLKFPVGSKACVTIGSRMRRDKLNQSCMRMRKLGNGHTVTFYLSHEAHDKVLQLKNELPSTGTLIETSDVIKWVKKNTAEFNQDGLLYWALSGRNYAQKLAAEDNLFYPVEHNPLHNTHLAVSKLDILAAQCEDDEVTLLKDMYGQYSKRERLVVLAGMWFAHSKNKLERNNGGKLPSRVITQFDLISNSVVQRCLEHVPEKKIFTNVMEDEQERELQQEKEIEIEEEQEIELPECVRPEVPVLDEHVVDAVMNFGGLSLNSGIVRLSDGFAKTTFSELVQPNCWGLDVFASKDFCRVVQLNKIHTSTDQYLRPVEYICSGILPCGKFQLLVLSSFEVNELLPRFWKNEVSMQLHMFVRRRNKSQELLINNGALQLPNGEFRPGVQVPLDCDQIAALAVASGSLYFENMWEQERYAKFLGLVRHYWGQDADESDKGKVSASGFLLMKHRNDNTRVKFGIDRNAFEKDPIGLVKKILSCRHSVVGDVSHVIRLLDGFFYVSTID